MTIALEKDSNEIVHGSALRALDDEHIQKKMITFVQMTNALCLQYPALIKKPTYQRHILSIKNIHLNALLLCKRTVLKNRKVRVMSIITRT